MDVLAHYECPNGHPVRAEKSIPCQRCNAHVIYEPIAVGLELRRQLQGAVERIKGLRLAVNPKDPDEREAAYARGYLAAVTDALETIVGGQ
jgi:hypothetical protein